MDVFIFNNWRARTCVHETTAYFLNSKKHAKAGKNRTEARQYSHTQQFRANRTRINPTTRSFIRNADICLALTRSGAVLSGAVFVRVLSLSTCRADPVLAITHDGWFVEKVVVNGFANCWVYALFAKVVVNAPGNWSRTSAWISEWVGFAMWL